jgi:hypothetical protein
MAQSTRRLLHAAIIAVVVAMFSITVQQALAALTTSQQQATLAFLQEFPREFSVLKNNWTGTEYCSWDGITCDADGNVSIDLSGKDLTGDMPEVPNKINWTDIMVTSINMSNNSHWNEKFEQSWGRLTNLRVLDLSNTALYSNIPDEWNGMTSLEEVYITNTYSCNRLPNWNIASLKVIDMSYNNLRNSLPSSWGNMTALTSVNIKGNNVCGCVPETWTSDVLKNAAAAIGNGVSDTDCASANSCNHRHDHCIQYNSKIAGLNLTQRHTLAFLQEFPHDIKYLKGLWTGVDYCSWEGITCDADGNVSIDLSGKDLTGDMPEIDSRIDGWLVQVVSIDMSNNPHWRDNFEEDWGRLRHLRFLNLSYTALKGDIPDEWNGMRALEEVHISHTSACKSLPDWTLPALRIVDFSSNNLHGTLSPAWSQMTNLTSVNLAGNGFCGCVPSTWTSVLKDAVSELSVSASNCTTSNRCTHGALRCWTYTVPTMSPSSTGGYTYFFLREFAANIPYLYKRWTGTDYCNWEGVSCDADGYVVVNLSGKGLTGKLPSLDKHSDGSQVLVVSLDMSNNPQLSGHFQDSWGELKQLRYLDLSSTGLYGNIPDSWNGMISLETVKISDTYACRNLPHWSLSSLQSAELARNNLRGTLSASWGSMTSLNTVDITGNSFCGCVPSTWNSSTVLTNAAAAIGGNLTAADCGVTNACNSNSNSCRNAAAVPVQATLAVVTALVTLVSAFAL